MPEPTSHIAFRGRYLDVVWEDGAEYVHNRRSRGVVLVIPVTAGNEIVFIEQYRVAFKSNVIEYPAGLVGDEQDCCDESFETAARRELLEEAGCEADALELVMRGPASPGSSTELVTFYLARNVRRIHEGGGVAHERIRVHAVPLGEAEAWLDRKSATGVLVDPRVYLGVFYAVRHVMPPRTR